MSDDKFTLWEIFTESTATHQLEIRWTRIGDHSKPPVVFIHGTPWSSFVWRDLASALSSRYCIYLYDHPGFGLSPQPRRHDGAESDLDPSLSLRAQASAALFQHWNLSKPAHVVAHDNAGLVSLRLYLEHGIKFASLCLIDVVAMGPSGSPFFDLVAKNQSVFQALPANFVEGFVRSYIGTASYKGLDNRIENLLAEQWLENGSQGPARFLQEMIQAHNRSFGDLEEQYPRVGSQIPVKIVWGANDSWIPKERASNLGDALNARDVVLVEDAGHLVLYDQPSKIAVELAMWFTANNQSF